MRLRIFTIAVVVLVFINQTGNAQNESFDTLRKHFFKTYSALQIPNLQVNYVQNLKSIKEPEHIKKQKDFFKNVKQQLATVNVNSLSEYQRLDFYIMNYETKLNLERISLEKQWNYSTNLNDENSIYTVENGKEWYAYLLKRWVNAEVSPDTIFQFGLDEIEQVKAAMKALQKQSGLSEKEFATHLNDTSFFFYNEKDVQSAFEKVKLEVAKKTSEVFPYIKEIPDVNITRGTNEALAQVPAYYNNSIFYFNYFNEPFNKRQFDWIYIHEGIPGHHYQIMVNNIIKRTDIQQLFWYSGFVEGWGAYVEYLGKELGVYKTIYDEYGKWEWDLIRSVRVTLDVGINYYGWSDDKAIAFWEKYISNQNAIGWREIARMKRWPAQVVTYKYGANKFLELLEKEKLKKDFSFINFHKSLLKYGDVPLLKDILGS